MLALTPAQMRQVDRRTIDEVGIPGIVLMERAALKVVEVLFKRAPLAPHDARVGVLCGAGNNGGDGFAIARLLHQRGVNVWVGALRQDVHGDARTNLEVLENLGVPVHHLGDQTAWDQLPEREVWVDALLGTGLDRAVEDVYAEAVEFLNSRA